MGNSLRRLFGRSAVLVILTACLFTTVKAQPGIWDSYVLLGSPLTTYFVGGTNQLSAPAFINANLGSFTPGSTYNLAGGYEYTYTNGDTVCGGALYYTVYLTSNGPGSFSPVTFNYNAAYGNRGNPNVDQLWTYNANNANILGGLAPGNYSLQIYYAITGSTSPGQCGTTYLENDLGFNYTADFSITPTQYSVGGSGSFCAGDTGLNPALSGSDLGVRYQLYLNGSTPIGSPIIGNGSALTFPVQTVAGTYTIVGTSTAAGIPTTATMSGSAVIIVNPLPNVGISGASGPGVCAGNQLTLNGTGAVSYAWNNNVTDGVAFTPDSTATYSVTGTDGNGCVNTAQATVNVNPLPIPVITTNGPTTFCQGGSVTLDAGTHAPNSGISYAAYLWQDNTTTTETYLATTTGTYIVTVTDDNGCSGSASFGVTVIQAPQPAISGPSAFCQDKNNDLSVTLDAGTNDPNTGNAYTAYLWQNNSENETLTVKSTGTYSVMVTDINSCTGSASYMVTANQAPLPVISGPLSLCQDPNNDLSVTLDAGTNAPNTGNPYIAYLWQDNSSNETNSVSVSGTYSVTVTDINGCTGSAGYGLTAYQAPLPVISGPGAFCQDETNDFSATLNAGTIAPNTGNAYISYLWQDNVTGSKTYSVSATGSYSVTVTDINGCTGSVSYNVTANQVPLPAINGPTVFCQDKNNDNSATLDAGSYAPNTGNPYNTYLWQDRLTNSETFPAKATGTYSVTATDINGCTGSASYSVIANQDPQPVITGPVAFCQDQNFDFSVSLSAGTNAPNTGNPYTAYVWQDNFSNETYAAYYTNTYDVTVTDNNGCTGGASYNVSANQNPQPQISGPTAFCQDVNNDLSASLDAGTNAPNTGNLYTAYLWQDSTIATEIYTVKFTGIYAVTVTDINGCTGSTSQGVTANQNPIPTITGSGSPAQFTECVSLTLDAGNNAPNTGNYYTAYQWQDNSGNETYIASASGTYSVTVTDNNGCSGGVSQGVTVNPAPVPAIAASGPTTFCQGDSVTFDAGTNAPNSGNPYIAYLWQDNVTTTETFSTSATGTYSISVTDNNGCTGSVAQGVTVNQNPQPVINGPTAFCQDKNNDFSSILDAGSYAPNTGNPYTAYLWQDDVIAVTTETFSAIATGTYSVTVTDDNGCTGSTSYGVTANQVPLPVINGPVAFCQDQNFDFSVTIDAGTNAPNTGNSYIEYLWQDNSGNETYSAYNTSTYSVTVTDINGCTGSTTYGVTANQVPLPVITGPTAFCQDASNDYSVTLDAGTNAPNTGNTYSVYLWQDNATTSETFSVTSTGDYSVMVTDINGCTGSASQGVTANQNPLPVITGYGSSSPYISCGTISIDAGTNAPNTGYQYSTYFWQDSTANESYTTSASGNYSVTVIDQNGCTGSVSQSVTVNLLPAPTLTPNGPTTFCSGYSVILDAGTNAPNSGNAYTAYLWQDNITISETDTITTTGTYSVTVTDINGCTGSAAQQITVNQSPQPLITGPAAFCQDKNSDFSIILDAGTNAPNTGYPYTAYLWQDNITTSETYPVTTTGTYTVTVTDNNGCTGSNSYGVTANQVPQPVISGPAVFCQDQNNDYSASLDAGTNDPLTGYQYIAYVWQDGSGNETYNATATGTYYVTVTDINGCTGSTGFAVTANQVPLPVITGPTAFCQDQNNDYSVTLDAGTNAPNTGNLYTSYLWQDNVTGTETYNVTSTNTYYVTVTDNNGCTGAAGYGVTANQDPEPVIAGSGSPSQYTSCASITLDAGTDAPNTGYYYTTYVWQDNSMNEIYTTSSSGTYIITVTDVNGCSGSVAQQVTVNTLPTPMITAGGPTTFCNGNSVILTAMNSGSSSAAFACSGFNADVIANGSNTSLNSTNDDIDGSGFIVASQDFNPGSGFCAPGADGMPGSGTITSTQGTGITYALQNYNSNNDLRIPAGHSNTLTLNTPTYISTLYVVCTGGGGGLYFTPTVYYQDGSSATLSQVYVSNWCSGGPNNLTGQAYYREQIGSFTNCEGYDCMILQEVPVTGLSTSSPVTSITFTNNSDSYPILNIFALGGVFQNTYAWSGGNSPNAAANTFTSTGTYSVTLTDENGCTGSASQGVTVNTLPSPQIAPNGPTTFCQGDSVTLDAGTSAPNTGNPYTAYLWQDNSVNETYSTSATGTYSVTVTDNNGCTGSTSQGVTVNTNPLPAITGSGFPSQYTGCFSITLNAGTNAPNTGNPYIAYVWQGNSYGETYSTSSTGTYNVMVTDVNGCTGSVSQSVIVNIGPVATITNADAAICPGGSNTISGTITESGAFTLLLNDGITTVTSQTGGNWQVSVSPGSSFNYNIISLSDTTGCSSSYSGSETVTVINPPVAAITSPDATICVGNSSIISGTISETDPFTLTLSDGTIVDSQSGGDWSANVNPGSTTTYTIVSLNDATGCASSYSGSETVTVNTGPVAAITSPDATICIGNSSTISGTISETGSFSMGLSDGTVINSQNAGAWSASLSPDSTATYTVVSLSDATGCTSSYSDSETVTVNTGPVAAITSSDVTICVGNSATISGTITETNPFTLRLSDGTVVNSQSGGNWSTSVSPASTATLTISALSDATGCAATYSDSETVTVNTGPSAAITSPAATICIGSSTTLSGTINETGLFSLTLSNGTLVSTENGGAWSANVTPAATTTYSISSVSDATGCAATKTGTETVTVNRGPVATITSPDTAICNGSSLTLRGTISETNPFTMYLSNGTLVNTQSGGSWSASLSPGSTTTYTISTLNDATGCASAFSGADTVTVNNIPTATINSPAASICSGYSTTISGTINETGAFTLTLSDGTMVNIDNGNSWSTFVNPDATTIYTINSLTDVTGCASVNSGSDTVSVSNGPLATITSADTTICSGVPITIRGTISATGPFTMYLSNGSLVNTESGGKWSAIESPHSTTTYTISSVNDASGCTPASSGSETVTVQPFLGGGVSVNPDSTVCKGTSVTLSGTGASTYSWSGGITNGHSFVANSSATYIVTCTNSSGCQNTLQIDINVNPLPHIGIAVLPDTTVCAGTSVRLNGTGAASYSWSGGITNGQSFAANTSAAYTVTGTDSNGCKNTAQTDITVNPLPEAPTISESNDTLISTAAASYQWYLSDSIDTGAVNRELKISQKGEYTVEVTNSNGCSNTSAPFNVTGISIIPIAGIYDIQLYPNPNDGHFVLQFSDAQTRYVSAVDVTGRTVMSARQVLQRAAFDFTSLPGGVYLLQIKGDDGVRTLQVVVTK